MSTSLVFEYPAECIADLVCKVNSQPYGSGERKGERQVQCARCLRWKYADERCNLFMHSGKSGVIVTQ